MTITAIALLLQAIDDDCADDDTCPFCGRSLETCVADRLGSCRMGRIRKSNVALRAEIKHQLRNLREQQDAVDERWRRRLETEERSSLALRDIISRLTSA